MCETILNLVTSPTPVWAWVWKGSEAAAGDDEQDRKVYDEAVLIAIESCLHRLRMNLMHLNATPVNTPVPCVSAA